MKQYSEQCKIKHNVETLGQVFTPQNIISQMIGLRKNFFNVLEPSIGNGAFLEQLKNDNITGIEIDSKFCPPGCINMDFFDYPIDNKFATIIGNPPYVGFKKIQKNTKDKLSTIGTIFDNRTNLYLFFIEKCFRHLIENGEIIFITPRDFIKATSSINLNSLLWNNGTITHFYDLGDNQVFKGYSPNCAIWRYEKDNFSHKTTTNDGERDFNLLEGQILFAKTDDIRFNDLFFVKVGAVSGADHIYTHPEGNKNFVCSYTKQSGQLKKMLYNIEHPHLIKHKPELESRRIKKFDESNWWMWGRNYYESELPRVYVNCKTRQENPFFTHPCRDYDGSVLAIFIKNEFTEEEAANKLNLVDWEELGFKVGGRYVFSQRSLQNIMLPKSIFK